MSGGNTRTLVLAAVLFVSIVAMGATAAVATPADGAVGPDATANETAVNTTFVGTVADEQAVTVTASGLADNGSPVDGINVTVTVGGETATAAPVTNGELVAEFDPTVLELAPTDSAEVGLAGFDIDDPATVEVVHEAFGLNESTRLRSVPQGAELAAENVAAVNVWNATDSTYDAVTDPVFDTDGDLHRGLYITPIGDDARVGYTFDTAATEAGTVELSAGWNFVSSNFNISATANLTVAEDLDLVAGDVSALDVFTADFSQELGPNDTVSAYDGYWVFVDEGDQPVERNIVDPAYNRDTREDVLGLAEGTVSFADQATASSTFTDANATTPGVVVQAEANVESAVVVTYQNGSDLVIAGLGVFSESELDGSQVSVPVTDFGGFPGNHTAHIIPVDELSSDYAPGDTVSNETAAAILDNEQATVFQGLVEFANQDYEDQTSQVTAATASLLGDGDTLFQVDLHLEENGAPGTFVGSSPVLSGANEDVPIFLQDTQGNPLVFNESNDYVAMIHVVTDENASEGDLFPPGSFPVLPNADANSGFVPGGVTDGGEVAIFSAEGAELSFDSQAVGIDDQGNAVVYVDNISEAEQVEQDISDPAEDFVVIYEGDTLTQDSLVDFRNVGDAENGELVLDVEDAAPGQHTVELFADSRTDIDPAATDVDHSFITDLRTESGGSDESNYILLLEDELSVDASADRTTVIEQLQSQATQAQQPVVETLDSMGVSVDRQFWIVNGVSVTVDTDEVSLAELERIEGVEHVVENVEYQLPTPAGEPTDVRRNDVSAQQTYGLQQIDVPNFEDTFGSQGEGSTVAIIDNGIGTTDPENVHPDINISASAIVVNGQIIEGELGPPGNHGLHTAGTATGAANPAGNVPRYSVAPAAELIKINSFAGGGSFLGDSLAGIQYSVTQDADVASLSLGLPPSATDGLSNIQLATEEATQNANNAGMSVVGAIGNEGSGAVGGPGGSPGPEFSTLGIGASNFNRGIAAFSSGDVITPNTVFPVTENGTLGQYPDTYPRSYVKPDVSAPGVQVLSAGPLGQVIAENPTYSLSQGTSMATPHVAGAIALIQSATDTQHDPKTIENALAETAQKPVGPVGERDIRYGTGIINVTAATLALQNTTTISGTVTDNATGETLTGAKITTDTGVVTSTDENGTYSIEVTGDADNVTVTADEFGYTTAATTAPLGEGSQTVDFALDPEVDVVPIVGQPAFAEFQDTITIVADVRNLEEYAVELTNATGVSPGDISVTVAGQTISPGENISFDPAVSLNGVPVTVAINGTFEEGDQFALAHTFTGLGDDREVTTGPTQLTETKTAAKFALSEFQAPSEQPDPGTSIEYAPQVTVTNVGQTPGAAEIRWFAGPLGLASENPVEQLEPGESTTVSLNFGSLNFFETLGGPVQFLHGFDAVPQGEATAGDLSFGQFTVGDGQVPLLDPIDPSLPRGAAETSEVYAADVSISDQTFEQSTDEVTVSASSVAPEDQEYVVVLHEAVNGGPGSIIGSSGDLNGTQEDITISLDQQLNATTGVVAMLHFASDSGPFGEPITAYDPEVEGPAPVTDAATVEVLELTFAVSGLDAPSAVTQGDLFDVGAEVTALAPGTLEIAVVDSTFDESQAGALADLVETELANNTDLDASDYAVFQVDSSNLLANTEYDTYIVNEFGDTSATAFLDALDEDQAAIMLDQNDEGTDGVSSLVQKRGDPAGFDETLGFPGNPEAIITADHPLFAGVGGVDDTVEVLDGGQVSPRAWFNNYTGQVVGDIGAPTDDTEPPEPEGAAFAVNDSANEVLLSSLGRSAETEVANDDYTADGNQILFNAVEYALFEQAGLDAPTGTPDVTQETQTVEFRFEGDTLRSTAVTLNLSETTTVEFGNLSSEIPRGTYEHGVFSQTGSATATIDIQEPVFFEVTEFEGPSSTAQTETVNVSATVTNTVPPGFDPIEAAATATQTVEYRIGDETLASTQVTLDANENQTVTFENVVVPESVSAGDRVHGIYTSDDNDTATVTVLPADAYQVSNLQPASAEVTQGDDPINISADVENFGGTSGEQDLVLEVLDESGTVVYEDTIPAVTLGPGESTSETFTGVPAGTLDRGTYTHRVATDDDDVTGTLSVLEPVYFEVSNLAAPAEVTQGETIDVSATVTNTVPPEPADVAVVDGQFDPNYAGAMADLLNTDLSDDRFTVDQVNSGDLLGVVDDYDVFVVNEFGSESTAEDFLAALGDDQSAIYLEQSGFINNVDAIDQLVEVRDDPETTLDNFGTAPVEMQIDTDHPVFDGVGDAGDTVTYFDSGDIGYLDGYSGDTLGQVVLEGTVEGPAIAVNDSANEVLLASSGRGPDFAPHADYTAAENQILLNAVEYAANQAGVELPSAGTVTPDATGTQTITYQFEGQGDVRTQSLTLDAGESRTVTFEDVEVSVARGNYTHGIASADTEQTATIEVLEQVNFAVSDLDAPVRTGQGDEITVTANVTNTAPTAPDEDPSVAVIDGEVDITPLVPELESRLPDAFNLTVVDAGTLLDSPQATAEQHDALVITSLDDGLGAPLDSEVEAIVDAAAQTGTGTVFVGQNTAESISTLPDATGDPASVTSGFGDGDATLLVDDSTHPLFEGISGDIVPHTESFNDYIGFSGYSGQTLAELELGSSVSGSAVAVNEERQQVLLGSMGATPGSFGPKFDEHVTAESFTVMANAIEFSADVTPPGVSVSPDRTGTQTVEFRFAGTTVASETVTLDAGETQQVSFTLPVEAGFGTFEHGVFTDDDNQTATIDVRSLAFGDQALGTNTTGTPAVLVEDVGAEAGEAVAVTYDNGTDIVVAGLTVLDETISGGTVPVAIEDAGGFPGEHTAHVITEPSDETAVGEPVSAASAASIAVQRTAAVFDAAVNITDQSFEDGTTELVVDASDLQPDGEYRILIQQDTIEGTVLGSSGNLTGAADNVTITVDEITTETDVAATLRKPASGESPPAIPVLDGEAFSMVTDKATVEILSAVGANLSLNDQATGSSTFTSNELTDLGVVVEDIEQAELEAQNVSNPSDDFVVLFDGTQPAADSIVDFQRISEADNGTLVFDLGSGNGSPVADPVTPEATSVHEWTFEDIAYGTPGNSGDEVDTITVDYPSGTSFDGLNETDVTVTMTRTLSGGEDTSEITLNSAEYSGSSATFDLFGGSQTDVAGPIEIEIDGIQNPDSGQYDVEVTLDGDAGEVSLTAPLSIVGGEYTAEIHADDGTGQPDPSQPRGAAETATVFQGAVSLADQGDSESIQEGDTLATLETADLLDGIGNDTPFTVDVHPTDDNGIIVGSEFVGSSDVLVGANSNVTVTAERVPANGTFNEFPIQETDSYVAMIHVVDDGSAPGDPASPGAYPVLPNTDAATGFVPGGVTDEGEIAILTGSVNGTVTASGDTAGTNQAAGEPIAGANVTLYQGNSTNPADEVLNTTTDANGEYSFDDVSTGNYTAEVTAADFAAESATLTVASNETETANFALDYAEAGTISGEITLDVADPGENVTVTVDVAETNDTTTVTLSGGTDTATYTLSDVDVNVGNGYTVTASSDSTNYDDPANATNVTVDVGATTENVNFSFARQTGGANGTVVASGDTASTQQTPGAGEGVENATLSVYAFQGDDAGSPTFTFESATDASGVFDLPDGTLPVGEHFVAVDATNLSSVGLPVTIDEGSNDLGEIALDYAEAGTITGEITLDVADPGENVTVTVDVVETSDTTTVTLSGGTDTATYTLSDVDVNVDNGYTVTASSDSTNYSAPVDAENVTVDVGATTTGVDFGFVRQTGDLGGTVTTDSGTPIENATVEVFGFGSGGPLVASAATDATGAYSIADLPVGEHFVTVSVDGSVAGNATATILSNQTTTADFTFTGGTFTVGILNNLTGTAGETQTAEIAVENTGDLPGTQTIDLDWGDGAYTNATSIELAGGADTVVSLSITTATNQALGIYNVTVTSDNDTAETTATLGPERSLNQTTVAIGGAVEVTVSGQVGTAGNVNFAEEWAPAANSSEILSTSFPTAGAQGAFADSVFLQSDGDVSTGPLEIVYEISVPNAAAGTLYEWEPFDRSNGTGSVLQLGADNFGIFGTQSFEVTPPVDNILLDSVSSLLNESGQPFTSQQQAQPLLDNSLVAIAAEPSASNEDSDGDGDAVIYPNDTEIPVVAVDGGVVGVSGPFVTTDTNFASYGNEEFMLNLYDELLGGSGTILHDEGHGQFYTLAPNGGDDFQAFADYAEANGYTYDNTTDIQNATGTADAFVITSPADAFTQSELDALSTFVDNGGVLFLHDQSDFNNFDATDNHNAIASAVNASFRFNDDQLVDDQNNTGARFVPETGNFNLDDFGPAFGDREGLGFELDVNETYQVNVTSVTDGDTASVEFSDGTVESVRIVGIDTPETGNTDERLEEYEGIDNATALKDRADGATAYAQNQLANKMVNLTFSPTEGLRGDFGRLLGFLELDDGSVFNEEIVRDGWARVYDSGFAQHDEYWDLEQQARANNSGIWDISDPATTSEIRDDPVTDLFFPQPVEVTGPETPVSSENGEPLVALDRDANVAAFGGPLIEERFETAEGGAGIGQYEVFPFVTNVMDAVGSATGPVVVDAGHDQFGVDYAVSAEDTAYYMRYLEGQSPGNESFIGLDGTVDLASEAGPDLVEGGSPAARAVVISTPTSELSPAERTAVADFADAGGAVILLGTSADPGALSNFDSLLSDLNTSVGFTGTNVTDATNNLGGDSTIPTTSNFSESQFPELFTAYTPAQSSTPFNVSTLVPADATVTEGEAFDVSATVTNEGTSSDEQTIELRLEPEGTAVLTRTVQLNASESTTVTFSNVTVDQAGAYNHTVASQTDQATGSLTVEQAFDDVFLDSVSSLLNASQGPLTDDSITAIEAEPTATNTDADGDGDAVLYPNDTDIPVVAVDGNVVGVTGPFVTSDTDFANYSNEEFLLNVYDKLLGGSGTILHDEGHGQFYDLSSFQTFAGFAENEGYTYDNTTDIQNATGTADAFVITSPSQAFTQSELDALSTFVDNGGVLFLHDQSDFSNFDATDNHNAIASAVNASFRFNDDQVTDSTNNGGASFLPVTGNFNEAEFPGLFTEASFNVSGLAPTDATVTEGEAFDVSATVTNNGDTTGELPVELRLEPDGSAVRTQMVQLGVGESTTVTFSNLTVEQVGEYNHTVATPGDSESGSLTVELADVFLDSVSSLLNASQGPLTDDSITAIEAESTASNSDSDGDGDAVSYPSDVDIPVVAVDGGVVGITGPFVTSDTDFANYSNEEFMLNVYDELLGGSGTILHDEGHGQFYTLSPNGGDDFQSFAGYAEANGYTYNSTTDIQNATGTADAFVITTPGDAFTQSELDALSTFVDNGGVLFLHDQSDFNNFDATDNHNAIASAVNASFRFNDDQVTDSTNNGGASFLPVTGNFNEAGFPELFSDRSDGGLTATVSQQAGSPTLHA